MQDMNKVMDILLTELEVLSTTKAKGDELEEKIDKARTMAMLACQYVAADSQQLRRQMVETQPKYKGIAYNGTSEI